MHLLHSLREKVSVHRRMCAFHTIVVHVLDQEFDNEPKAASNAFSRQHAEHGNDRHTDDDLSALLGHYNERWMFGLSSHWMHRTMVSLDVDVAHGKAVRTYVSHREGHREGTSMSIESLPMYSRIVHTCRREY